MKFKVTTILLTLGVSCAVNAFDGTLNIPPANLTCGSSVKFTCAMQSGDPMKYFLVSHVPNATFATENFKFVSGSGAQQHFHILTQMHLET